MSQLGGSINISEITKASFQTLYTPIVTGVGGAVTTNSTYGLYVQLGKLVYVEISVGLNTVAGGTTGVYISLPFNIDTSYVLTNPPVLHGWDSANAKFIYATLLTANIAAPVYYDGTSCTVAGHGLNLTGWFKRAL